MGLVLLASREIRRSLGRFALLTAAVALLVLLLLFFQSVGDALTRGLTGAIDASTAEVLVYDDRARRNPSASVLDAGAAEQVAAVAGVAAAAPVGITTATGSGPAVEDPSGEVDVAVFGIDPDGPGLPRDIGEGRAPRAAGEAVVGVSPLGEGFAVGDVVTVAGREIEVVGVADGAAYSVGPTLYVPAEDHAAIVQAVAGAPVDVPPDLVAVDVAEGADPVAVAAAITDQVAGVEALDRATAVGELPGVDAVTQSFAILTLLLVVVVAIVTGVFFLILTVQKAEALVLLRAVGARRRDVLAPVLLQVLLVTGLGAALGTAAAAGLLHAARDVFGSSIDPVTAAVTAATVVGLGLLASTGAVRRVLAIDPVDAVTASAR